MTANERGWWPRFSSKHISPWPDEELSDWRAEQQAERDERLIGPVPPPNEPAPSRWPIADRKGDPALEHPRLFPRPEVPHVLDDYPH